jgi:branched-chain amino acid transport system substrate-binding protein
MAVLVLTACGTRVPEQEMSEAAPRSASGVDTSPVPERISTAVDPGATPVDTVAPRPATSTSPGPPVASAPSSLGAGGGAPGILRPGTGAPVRSTTGTTAAKGTGPKSDVLVASVGTLSGPVGSVLVPLVRGMQVWQADVNGRGGVNGHTVRVIVYDDGGDPARHRSQVQEAIEHRRVIAFLQNTDALTGAASVDYITAKRVPMVGGDQGQDWGLRSPMFFPHVATGQSVYAVTVGAPARLLVPAGKKRLGWVVCVEAQICSDADRLWNGGMAERVGFQPVYRGKASFTQPDYTAECLAAQSAGAEVFLVVLDPTAFERLAKSCVRQGYRPVFVPAPGLGQADRMKDNPDLEGMVAAGLTFLYFQRDTPATDAFQQAMRRYGAGITLEQGVAQGWASGKLFERAAQDLPEPPTNEALLRGLWSIAGDTLGGLTQPLTFVENRLPSPRPCWFAYRLVERAWVSQDGFRLQCMEG